MTKRSASRRGTVRSTRRQSDAPPVAALTWEQVRAWRLRRHHLHARQPADALLTVAANLCGLQAQVMSSAELASWARLDELAPDAVRRALWDERGLVKTWAMRGTLHLLPAAEFPLWLGALSAYRHYYQASWLRYFGVTAAELDQIVAAIGEALQGEPLTREELAAAVARRTGSTALGEKLRGSWGAMLKPAAFQGQLCFAPSRGQQVRFTHPAGWLGGLAPHDADEARLAIMRRYLAAYGPATRDDFARWFGTTPRDARGLIEALGDAVVPVEVSGTRAWLLAEHLTEAQAATPGRTVNLLPGFDPYVLGASRHAGDLLPGAFKARVYRPRGWVSPVLLVNGRMDGVWRHERRGRQLDVTITPFIELPTWARRGAEAEAERLAAFLGGTLALRRDG